MSEHWETTAGDVVEVWQGDDQDWHWHVQAANGEIVEGGEGYTRRDRCVEAALRHHPRVDVAE